ncbi:Glycosyltransferase [Hirschfeldia incana]|nr:Glycosyltransferase [Hirschfeldia incana]
MPSQTKLKRPNSHFRLCIFLFFTVPFTIPALLLIRASSYSSSSTAAVFSCHDTTQPPWSGDLQTAQFAWNRLAFSVTNPPPKTLKIAVFSRKWPTGPSPGGMERHALTLHTVLAHRGHRVHVFTSPLDPSPETNKNTHVSDQITNPTIHPHGEAEPGKWRYNKAWELYEEENLREPFDVVHSESVSLPHWIARKVPNLAVSWHGIALESLQSSIYQDLIRKPGEARTQGFNASLYVAVLPKILDEIRFFHSYAHHVATSDSSGEMLRDVYQIPKKRVHVILNGVDENRFTSDKKIRSLFRSKLGLPENSSTIVLGAAGRLVKDKGHPLLFEAFSRLIETHFNVHLVVAGSGPWEKRYKELGEKVTVLGPLNPDELKGFYNGIDLLVNPTLRPQGLDITLMEAMLSGKPMMTSRYPSIKRSVLVNDEFGFMFAPNVEALTEVMEVAVAEGAERLAERGRKCREYATEMFTATKRKIDCCEVVKCGMSLLYAPDENDCRLQGLHESNLEKAVSGEETETAMDEATVSKRGRFCTQEEELLNGKRIKEEISFADYECSVLSYIEPAKPNV